MFCLWCYFLKNSTNKICAKRMHRLVSVRHFTHDYTQTLSAFSSGKTQHAGRMRSRIASVINYVLEFGSTLVLFLD